MVQIDDTYFDAQTSYSHTFADLTFTRESGVTIFKIIPVGQNYDPDATNKAVQIVENQLLIYLKDGLDHEFFLKWDDQGEEVIETMHVKHPEYTIDLGVNIFYQHFGDGIGFYIGFAMKSTLLGETNLVSWVWD